MAHFRDGNSEAKLLLTAYHLSTVDERELLTSLEEDGAFGAHVCEFRGQRLVSRDLLDSISEIYFLEDSFGLSGRDRFNVLDIGAGYGRLAHRLSAAFPERAWTFCTDAVAVSTFVCEFYLSYRGVERGARVVPLDELQDALERVELDLAVNVHSFSECPVRSIAWWLDLLREHEVPYLMVVPHAQDHGGKRLLALEMGGRRVDYTRELTVHGYRLAEMRPKYVDPAVQRAGVSPTHYHLFELRR